MLVKTHLKPGLSRGKGGGGQRQGIGVGEQLTGDPVGGRIHAGPGENITLGQNEVVFVKQMNKNRIISFKWF
jgi:hypothetical protein